MVTGSSGTVLNEKKPHDLLPAEQLRERITVSIAVRSEPELQTRTVPLRFVIERNITVTSGSAYCSPLLASTFLQREQRQDA